MSARRLFLALALASLAVCAVPRESLADKPDAPLPACIHIASEARYDGVGYSHIVHIDNGCSQLAVCSVATDVNPSPITTRIPAGQSDDVVTWRGSPARVFTATVSCALES